MFIFRNGREKNVSMLLILPAQTSETSLRFPVNPRKISAHVHRAPAHGKGIDIAIRIWVPGCERSVRIDSGKLTSSCAVDRGEPSPCIDRAPAYGKGIDQEVRVRVPR